MARTNYGFQKRQKELAKQQKKEEKRLRKLDRKQDEPEDGSGEPVDPDAVAEADTAAEPAKGDAEEKAPPAE